MAIPWLRIIDAALGIHDLVRVRKTRPLIDSEIESEQLATRGALGGLETRLAGVVVAALKEAFDRDTRRLELERQQLDAERRRAERAQRLELLRQAGDREIGRLRVLAGVASAGWIATLFVWIAAFFLSPRASVIGAGAPRAALTARLVVGGGWILLLLAITLSFLAQSAVGRALQRAADDPDEAPDATSLPRVGDAIPWLIVSGLALVGLAVLIW
ncbi:MAG TPA: hypothetical protein VGY48_31965 [Vicinamibacterales bacterium]|jgi:hypothetical protein|nr:hypothetical protein [Vicinamibacterales bacterium]